MSLGTGACLTSENILDPYWLMQPAAPARRRVCHWKRHRTRQGTCNTGSASHRKTVNAARISLTCLESVRAAQTCCKQMLHRLAAFCGTRTPRGVCAAHMPLKGHWESLGLTGRGVPNTPCWPIGSCSTGCGQSRATVARCVRRHTVQRLAASSCHAPARPHLPANL